MNTANRNGTGMSVKKTYCVFPSCDSFKVLLPSRPSASNTTRCPSAIDLHASPLFHTVHLVREMQPELTCLPPLSSSFVGDGIAEVERNEEGTELIAQQLSLVQFSISCQPSIPHRQPLSSEKMFATGLLVRFQQYPLPHDSAVSSYLSSADVAKKEAQRITDQLSHFILEKGEKETPESAEKKPVQLAPNPPLSRELEKEEEQEQNEDTSEQEDNSESNQLEGDEEKAAEEEGKENQPPKELEKDTHLPTESEKEKDHQKQDRAVPATSSTQTPAAAPTTTATSFKNPYRSHHPPKVTAERVMKQYIQNNSTVISTVESIASIREDHPVGNSLFLFVNDPSGQYVWKEGGKFERASCGNIDNKQQLHQNERRQTNSRMEVVLPRYDLPV
ncbi:hypothetical protein BLNAU_10970 [Blattamonas nauphoetae]|uniref:Uncharacterized protein n=1 Tax=Blattamonas nauphoetae TaxID=2049346 RepID=A0ABQ9XRN0_9EUKA|nr:hypothetical protein BLNAU_10970 [Blattamonas nauphoetae]